MIWAWYWFSQSLFINGDHCDVNCITSGILVITLLSKIQLRNVWFIRLACNFSDHYAAYFTITLGAHEQGNLTTSNFRAGFKFKGLVCLIRGRISTTCVMTIWGIDVWCKYMFMFHLKSFTPKGLKLWINWPRIKPRYSTTHHEPYIFTPTATVIFAGYWKLPTPQISCKWLSPSLVYKLLPPAPIVTTYRYEKVCG